MEITTKITLDMLNSLSVSILTQRFTTIENETVQVGQNHRKAYVNSERGRSELVEEVPEPYLTAVLSLWGDSPILTD